VFFVERLEEQMRLLIYHSLLNLAVKVLQELHAHHVAYPQIDWRKFGGTFVEENLGYTLSRLHKSNITITLQHF
jgi:adenylosuccinate lyase